MGLRLRSPERLGLAPGELCVHPVPGKVEPPSRSDQSLLGAANCFASVIGMLAYQFSVVKDPKICVELTP